MIQLKQLKKAEEYLKNAKWKIKRLNAMLNDGIMIEVLSGVDTTARIKIIQD